MLHDYSSSYPMKDKENKSYKKIWGTIKYSSILVHIYFSNRVDPFEANALMKQLINIGQLKEARSLFDKMPQRDEISWTTIISGYINTSNASEALILFSSMWGDDKIRIDPFILSLAFKACGSHSDLKLGESIHGYSIKTGFVDSVFVGSALLDMYTKVGKVAIARSIFDEMPMKNVVSWTAIISGLVRAGQNVEGLRYFSAMWLSDVECDSYTFASVLKACADSGALTYGKAVHTQTIKSGFNTTSFVANTLAYMYNKCGKLDYGLCLFERMQTPDVVSWTMIIATYVQMGCEENALKSFLRMRGSGVNGNEFTFAAVISGSGGLVRIMWGQQLHAHVFCLGLDRSMSVANALMTMYAKCGCLSSASIVFHDMASRDVVSWSAIIAGYCQGSLGEEAFELFSEMRTEGIRPNEFTLASLMSVCATMAIVEQGKQIHAYILSIGVEHDPMINSALINMYSKCGSIGEAKNIFDAGSDDLVSWTAMINGFAEHGCSAEAIDLFEKMSAVGLRPDSVTFIGVLSACSHAGLVNLGFQYFNSMSRDYQINPGKEHYGCMIDILCRAGMLRDAESLINKMPFKPDDVVWSTLLRACGLHGDVERARRTAKHILELDPNSAGTHITISNIYSSTGMWTDAAYMRKLMKSKGVRKEPGWSCIKVIGKLSAFVAGDRCHPHADEIYEMLRLLASRANFSSDDP
ncbi:putative pentatricopeptide repeat-containing protein At3g47840 [Aristolochia californica]|uniref:putative pentatricopeptide repeat-containing protein At3g47840 n=1 Tax=Aristolochia californica TaxID=171875 RepID=UPI0035DA0395